ncbi:MAG TPA: DNA methyltransferase [Holophaga sp.]|nr:DNA methyltransferase [Holophaga sp.]
MQADSALGGSRKALEALAPDGEAGQWSEVQVQGLRVPCWERAFWTARQRQAHSLHEISYRACYKPQLPRCFIEALTAPDDRVLDPFGGRGTTGLEAALLGRRVASNDANPLSALLLAPAWIRRTRKPWPSGSAPSPGGPPNTMGWTSRCSITRIRKGRCGP